MQSSYSSLVSVPTQSINVCIKGSTLENARKADLQLQLLAFYKASSIEQTSYSAKTINPISSEGSGILQPSTANYREAFYGTKKNPTSILTPFTYWLNSQMHEKIASQDQHVSPYGPPSRFLP